MGGEGWAEESQPLCGGALHKPRKGVCSPELRLPNGGEAGGAARAEVPPGRPILFHPGTRRLATLSPPTAPVPISTQGLENAVCATQWPRPRPPSSSWPPLQGSRGPGGWRRAYGGLPAQGWARGGWSRLTKWSHPHRNANRPMEATRSWWAPADPGPFLAHGPMNVSHCDMPRPIMSRTKGSGTRPYHSSPFFGYKRSWTKSRRGGEPSHRAVDVLYVSPARNGRATPPTCCHNVGPRAERRASTTLFSPPPPRSSSPLLLLPSPPRPRPSRGGTCTGGGCCLGQATHRRV